MGRSRSPRGRKGYQQWEEWISRQIVNFGRHPAKRPKGLSVDSEGNMLLEQVMRLWGYEQELQDNDVLCAIHENMFHEDGTLRFAIDNDRQGRLKIRVLPKRDKRNCASPSGVWVWMPSQGSSWCSETIPEKRAPRRKGRAANQDLSTANKIDMPLEMLIESEQSASSMAPSELQETDQAAYLRTAFNQATLLQRETKRLQKGGGSTGKGKRRQGKGSFASKKVNEPEPNRHRRAGSRSPSQEGSEDDALAEITRRALHVASPLATDGMTLAHPNTPAPPPGPHWTKYEDDGKIWYYYEGPLGKFWCASEKQDIQPYEEDD